MAGEVTYWDPKTGTYKTGVPPQAPADPSVVPGNSTTAYDRGNRDPRQWGGYGRATDVNGRPIVGSSAGEKDVARYRGMGAATQAAPVIDQTRSNETRGIQDRALGYLGAASTGADSMARRLGEQQTAAAVNSTKSLAATVRGGPMARAAAARSANQGQGALEARGRLATDAAAATEQAGARGAYAGALQGQRSQDLGLATSQAGLDSAQRTADDQREGFYEGLGWDTANAQLENGLGVSRSDQAAGQASRAAASAEADRRQQGLMDTISTVAGGSTGLAQGAAAAAKPKPDDRYGGSGTSTSDIKSKTAVSDIDALKMKKRAQGAIDETKASLERGGYFGGPPDEGMGKEALDRAIGKRVEDDLRPRYGYFDENQQPERPDWLVGYMNSAEQGDSMPSDDKTKLAEAWDQGHAAAIADVEKAGRASPAEIKRRSEGDDYNPAHAAVRGIKSNAWEEGHKEGDISARMKANRQKMERDFEEAGKDAPVGPATPKPEPMATDIISTREQLYGGKPTPTAPPSPGYVDQLLGRAKAFISPRMTSDERAKESKGYHPGAMADAMRSMKPSVYEYKPEYAGRAGQDVGEKNVGPMANPMSRDPVASTAIERQPDGMLAIDKDKALKLTMGGLADLQMQIDQLKGRKGRAA